MFQNDRTMGLTQEEKDERLKTFYEEIKEHPYPKPGSGEVPWALAFLKLMAPMIYEKETDTFLAYRREEGIWKPKNKDYLTGTLMILSAENPYGAKHIDKRKAATILRHASQYAKPDKMLRAEGLLNLVNGMFNPVTGDLLPHHPGYYSKAQLPVRDDPGAAAPRWMRFLEETFYDDPAKALVLQEFFGYTLWREDCRFHKALILIGGGPGGKSVIAKIMLGMMGFDNATTMDTKQITSRFGTALLAGRLVNISTQGFTNLDPIDTEMMKALISGDLVLGEQKFGRSFNFQNRAKFLFVTNSPPYFREDSHGSKRRFLVLTCNRNLPPSKQDPCLDGAMWREEIDGIFNWAVEGLQRLLKQDIFTTSPGIEEDRTRVLQIEPPFTCFINQACIVGKDATCRRADLHKHYLAWCKVNPFYGMRPLGYRKFMDAMLQVPGVLAMREGKTEKIYSGIAAKPQVGAAPHPDDIA